ncbi:Uma2 family endonuclease [Nocardia sp. NPDC049149]|uniref:Uma2 family endonuclease n=1 Tax=Nocardia sp. NPDC049149 TaxID=3364315 RepID=UPI003724335E
MTVEMHWPDHLLTLADWNALPEDNSRSYELVEGVLLVSPRPVLRHQYAILQLGAQLEPQLIDSLSVVTEAEVVIDPATPSTVRVPDVMVIRTKALDENLPRANPEDVLLAVEVLSPGSKRTDRVTKFVEYAEVGIQYYWLIDLDAPPSLSAYHLINGEYELVSERSGQITLDLAGDQIHLDLATLTRN